MSVNLSAPPKQASLNFNERVCASCGKVFIIPYAISGYTFKLQTSNNNTDYFCKYSHYKAEQEAREQGIKDRALAKKKERTKEPYKYQKYTD